MRFNNVDLGQDATFTVNIRYAGRPDWNIVDAKTDNPHLTARLIPGQRDDGRIDYRLVVKLNSTAGSVADALMCP